MRYCDNCGEIIEENSEFCDCCGYKVENLIHDTKTVNSTINKPLDKDDKPKTSMPSKHVWIMSGIVVSLIAAFLLCPFRFADFDIHNSNIVNETGACYSTQVRNVIDTYAFSGPTYYYDINGNLVGWEERDKFGYTRYRADGSIFEVGKFNDEVRKYYSKYYNLYVNNDYFTYNKDGSIKDGYSCVDDNHEIIETKYENGKKSCETRHSYDEAGHEIEYITYRYYERTGDSIHYKPIAWTITQWEKYEYDAAGNKIRNTWYYADGAIGGWYERGYDAAGNKIKETKYYKGDGTIDHWYEYEYDTSGHEIKETHYNGDGTIDYWEEREYGIWGNEKKETRYNGDGTIDSWMEYEYSIWGNEKKGTRYYGDSTIAN